MFSQLLYNHPKHGQIYRQIYCQHQYNKALQNWLIFKRLDWNIFTVALQAKPEKEKIGDVQTSIISTMTILHVEDFKSKFQYYYF